MTKVVCGNDELVSTAAPFGVLICVLLFNFHKGSVTFSVCYRYFGARKTRRAAEKKSYEEKKVLPGGEKL